jgi:cyanophycinase-like exopeptidase
MIPGKIAFLGSGETSRAGGTLFEKLVRELGEPPRIAILETPAGFELNSHQVAGRVASYMRSRLQNYGGEISVIPARKRGTPLSPDEPQILQPLANANLIFMGPGSPTYAVRQLRGTLAWDLIRARHRAGATLAFSSSATIAVGSWVLPVYEVYKAGEDMHMVPGLALFEDYGLQLSFIPHWNNAEGGEDVDTSRCFVGMERFAIWRTGLPDGHLTLGLDEHTWLVIDPLLGGCEVGGVSTVSLVGRSDSQVYPAGAIFDMTQLGLVHFPEDGAHGLDGRAWEMASEEPSSKQETPSPAVQRLFALREEARARQDWDASDRLRTEIASLGWTVQDTEDGQQLIAN